ncbi:MAG TPA: NAD(P)H-hydrate dehydratase [Methanocorpusculum sp.]|nr:NAD(P)H-hydrate dehydratase [Methanocorpusculum sp.]
MRIFASRGIISTEEMRAIDRNADEYGVTPRERMEAAGVQLANAIRLELPHAVLFLCGPGNNGGDGYVAARHLAEELNVYVLSFGAKTPEAEAALAALKQTSAFVVTVDRIADLPEVFDTDYIIDCLLGTGARKPLSDIYAAAVERINASSATVIACDVPTPGARADRIIAFHAAKVANSEVVSIGIPLAAEVCCGPGDLLELKRKSSAAHKGAGGKVLVIGGGPYQGAPFLAAEAALRGGADIVRLASPVDGFAPDVILERLPGDRIGSDHIRKLVSLAAEVDVVVAGPGLGDDAESLDAVRYAVSAANYAVVDADALRAPLPKAKIATIYTPHAGEFSRVFGFAPDPTETMANQARTVSKAAERAGGTILLKGKYDIISDGTKVKFNCSGDAAMTVGGTGDVLAGLCGGIFCRLKNPMAAACAAAYAAGKGGELVAEVMGDGMTASDLLQGIGSALWKR